MANEVTFACNLKAVKNGAIINQSSNMVASMTGDDMMQNTQNIGTTAELVTFGDITGAPQQVMIKNLDATNFIELGGDSGLTVFKIKLLAGLSCLFTPSSAILYAKANTASVLIMVAAVEV
jgi:hypothetical protein